MLALLASRTEKLAMHVVPVPCYRDNYAYLVFHDGARDAVVIDPSDAAPIEDALEQRGLAATALLCTHHHGDHVDGVEALLERRPGTQVVAHESDRTRTPGVTSTVAHGDVFEAAGLAFRALHVPGHTLGAVTWVIEDCAFTGDTLFLGGCGRVFEGTPEMMFHSLHDRLADLDPSTRVYCGHEYTESNLVFASHVEPRNAALAARLDTVRRQRSRREPTVPGTLGDELETNPFLRCRHPDVIDFARSKGAPSLDPVAVFALIRGLKNTFQG